jgi:1-acyl-sn-glycerol-3-phosphate acyltransferase
MKYVRYVLTALPTIIHYYPYLNKCSKKPEYQTITERFNKVQEFLRTVNRKAFHIVFYISGQEKLPKGQVIFTPNHTSNGDPITMLCTADRPIAFLSKKEVLKMPIIGKANKTLRGSFIDRADLRSELVAFKQIDKELDESPELSYVIFPEGTRSLGPDFKLGQFHPGSFKVAYNRNLPICPVVMYLTDRVLNPHYHYKKYPIQVRFLTPLYPADYEDMTTKDIANLLSQRMAIALEEMKKSDPLLVKNLNGYSDKKISKVLICKKDIKKR